MNRSDIHTLIYTVILSCMVALFSINSLYAQDAQDAQSIIASCHKFVNQADTLDFVDRQMQWQDAQKQVSAFESIKIDHNSSAWVGYYIQLHRLLAYLDPFKPISVYRPYIESLKQMAESLPPAYQSVKWYTYQELSRIYLLDHNQKEACILQEDIIQDIQRKEQRNAQDTIQLTKAMIGQLFCNSVLSPALGRRNHKFLCSHPTDSRIPLAIALYKKRYSQVIKLCENLLYRSDLPVLESYYFCQLIYDALQHVPATRTNTQRAFRLLAKQKSMYSDVQQAINFDYNKYQDLQKKLRTETEIQKQKKTAEMKHIRVASTIGALLLVLLLFVWVMYHHSSAFEEFIQEQVREEEATRKSTLKEAQKAYQSQLKLVRNLNHDIRVPLNTLLGFTHILSSPDPLTHQEQQEAGEAIRQSSAQLLDMINNLLSIARVETHKMSLHMQMEPIAKLLEPEVWEGLVAKLAPTHSLYIEPTSSQQEIKTDFGHLRNIVTLCINDIVRQTETNTLFVSSHVDPLSKQLRISIQAPIVNLSLRSMHDALDDSKRMSDYDNANSYYLVLARMLAHLINGQLLLQEDTDTVHLNLLLPLSQ